MSRGECILESAKTAITVPERTCSSEDATTVKGLGSARSPLPGMHRFELPFLVQRSTPQVTAASWQKKEEKITAMTGVRDGIRIWP